MQSGPKNTDSQNTEEKKSKIVSAPIPFVPSQVDLKDLKSDRNFLSLLSKEEVETVDQYYSQKTRTVTERKSKKDLKIEYSVIKANDQIYAIYKGEKHKKLLGEGAFGKVKLAQNIKTGEWVALKILTEDNGISKDSPKSKYITAFEYKNKKGFKAIQILMTLAKGQNAELLAKKSNFLTPIQRIDMAIDILKIISEMHKENILHRDIKCANIIYDLISRKASIVDWDTAIVLKNTQNPSFISEWVGTPGFQRPDFLRDGLREDRAEYNFLTEYYATGVMLAEIFNAIEYEGVDFKVSSAEEKRFVSSMPYKKIRDQILSFCDKLMNRMTNRSDAINTIKIIEGLESSKENMLKIAHIRRIGVLHVNDFVANDKKLIDTLKLFDQVWLIDDENKGTDFYLHIHKELEKNDVLVSNQVLKGTNKSDIIQELPGYLQNIEPSIPHDLTIINTGKSFVVENNAISTVNLNHSTIEAIHQQLEDNFSRRNVTKEDYDIISSSLKTESERLSKKMHEEPDDKKFEIMNNRVNEINISLKEIEKLFKNNKLTYKSCLDSLHHLESKMSHTSWKKFLPKFFQPKTTGKKNIQAIKNEIESSIKPKK